MLPQKSVWHEEISIHALREEGDYHEWYGRIKDAISIHALREEGDVYALLSCL